MVSKTFSQNWADALAASHRGSRFEQEELHALDEEDVRNSLGTIIITSLALSAFETVTVTSTRSVSLSTRPLRCYECALSLSTASLS